MHSSYCSPFFFLFNRLTINCTIKPVEAITIAVVTIQTIMICIILDFKSPREVIKLTPAGIKKKAKWSKKKVDTVSTCSTFIIFVQSATRSNNRPIMFPGIGMPVKETIASPIKHIANMISASLNNFKSISP